MNRIYHFHAPLLLFFMISVSAAHAQQAGVAGDWRLVGPMSWDHSAVTLADRPGVGSVLSIAVAPPPSHVVLVGTNTAGIWRSTDDGAHWANVSTGVSNVPVVTMCREKPDYVYALADGKILGSTDRGATWNVLNGTYGGQPVNGTGLTKLEVAPTQQKQLMCLAGSTVLYSTDGGGLWSKFPRNDTAAAADTGRWADFRFHPTDPKIVYLLWQYTGYPYSEWYNVNRSVSFAPGQLPTSSEIPVRIWPTHMNHCVFAVTPAAPNTVNLMIAGTSGDSTPQGVFGHYVSTDAGLTYTHHCCGLQNGPEKPDTAAAVRNPNLFGETPLSTNMGDVDWAMAFAASDVDPNVMVVGAIHPWRSSDGGTSWSQVKTPHRGFHQVVSVGGVFWAATDQGVVRSRDGGLTFEERGDGIAAMEVTGISQTRNGNGTAIAARRMPMYLRDDTVYANNGYVGSWYPYGGVDVGSITVNPMDARWVYCSVDGGRRVFRSNSPARLPSSQSLGIDLRGAAFRNLEVNPASYFTLVAADASQKRIVRSTDNGSTWTTLKAFQDSATLVRLSSARPEYMFAVGDGQFWSSQDTGRTWTAVSRVDQIVSGARPVIDVALSDSNQLEAWALLGGRSDKFSVVHTTNGGISWQDYAGGLSSQNIRCIALQHGSRGLVYAGTNTGAYYRDNLMPDWQTAGTNLPTTRVNGFSINYDAGTISAATDRGVWETDLVQRSSARARISCDRTEVACSSVEIHFANYGPMRRTANMQFRWTFPGGTPATSTDEYPRVRYATPGIYDVQLQIQVDAVTYEQLLHNFITVRPSECGLDSIPGLAARFSPTLPGGVELPHLNANTNTLSITAWVMPDTIQADSSAIYSNEAGLVLGFKNKRNELAFRWGDSGWAFNSGLVVPAGRWSHVAMMVDTNGVMLSVDGRTNTMAFTTRPIDFTEAIGRIGEWRIGDWSRAYTGLIDELGIYNRTISKAELRRVMHLIRNDAEAELIHYYQFNERSPADVFDRYGVEHSTSAWNLSRVVSTIPAGPGISFGRYVGDSGSYDLNGTGVRAEFSASGSYINGDLVAYRINILPDTVPAGTNVLSNTYWIVRNFGSNVFAPPDVLEFSRVGPLIQADAENPAGVKLYQRDHNEHRDTWGGPVALGGSVNVAERRVVFPGNEALGTFGQFYIASVNVADAPQEGAAVAGRAVIYPNPCTNAATLVLPASRAAGPARVRLYDALGRTLSDIDVPGVAGGSHVHIDVSWLPGGSYFIGVDGEYIRFVKQ